MIFNEYNEITYYPKKIFLLNFSEIIISENFNVRNNLTSRRMTNVEIVMSVQKRG